MRTEQENGTSDRLSAGSTGHWPPQAAVEAVTKAIVFLVVPIAILITTFVSVIVLDVLPSGQAPAYVLFPYYDEVVGISLWGGLVPVLTAFLMIELVARGNRNPRPFRSRSYWLVVAAIALLATVVFSASHELIGGVGLSTLAAYVSIQAGAVMGIGYWWFRGRRFRLIHGFAECYVMGTLGMFGSDIIRTLTLLASTPGAATVWGGNGLHDLVLWFGLYVSLSFVCVRALLPFQTRLSRSFLKDTPRLAHGIAPSRVD